MIELALLLVVGVVGLLYLYFSHVYSYWIRKGLPQPPVVWGFGNILDAFLLKRGAGRIYTDIYRTFPGHSAVGLYGCATPKLLVRSPHLIQRVMVSDFSSFHDNEFFVTKKVDPYFYEDPFILKGDEWKPSRAKAVSAMTAIRVKEVFPLMRDIIPRLKEYIDSNIGKDIKTKDIAGLFMMDNVSNIVFGINSNCFSDPEAAFRRVADIQMNDQLKSWWRNVVFACMPNVRDFLGIQFVPDAVTDYIKSLVQQMYQFRKKSNEKRNDLFQFFMSRENGDDIEELMNYGMLFFLEGFETSSMAASSVIYELAVNPEVQERLYDEVSSALGDKRDFDWDTIYNLPYLAKVVKGSFFNGSLQGEEIKILGAKIFAESIGSEAMRKYPVMYANVRECTRPITLEIDGKSVDIEPGTSVIVPTFAVQRDPQYYPDPETFDPERFSEENISTRPPYTYMPFGEGPRICPGMRFALTQVKLLICSLVFNYKILSTEKTPRTLTFQPGNLLVWPNEEEWIKLEKRN